MYMLDLEKSEEPDIKLPISLESQKKQVYSRKTSIFASFCAQKPLTVCITTSQKTAENSETGIQDHHTCPLRTSTQGKKQQLEIDMELGTVLKLGKEYVKAINCHPAYLT